MQMTIVMNELSDEEVLKILDVVATTTAHAYVDTVKDEESITIETGDIIFVYDLEGYFFVNAINEQRIQLMGREGIATSYPWPIADKFEFEKVSREEEDLFKEDLKRLGGIDLESYDK